MKFRILLAPAAALLLLAGCDGLADLEVENQNDPDTERVLATPGDVVGLVGGAYRQWWRSAHHYVGAGPALSVAADAHSASWGNFAMQDFGTEPRIPIRNDPSYGYSYVVEAPWSNAYSALKAVNDGLRAMDGADGAAPLDLDDDEAMVRAFAKFVQGLALGQLALMYDQAFIFTDRIGTAEIEAGLELRPYDEVMDTALVKLQDAIDIAAAAEPFETPDTWIYGQEVDNELLIQLAHSYMARFIAGEPRLPDEAAGVDWDAVITHAEAGVTDDFGPFGDGFNFWYDGLKSYGGVYGGWGRLDLRFLGMADASGEYQAWLGTPPGDRTEFLITTSDRRITGDTPDSDGVYVQYFSSIPFRPERGTYFFSNYGDMRWISDDSDCGPDEADDPVCEPAAFNDYANLFTTEMVDVTPREMRLLIAEAHIMNGAAGLAADIINETREEWLPPVTAAGVPTSADCVPREPDTTGACGDLMTALHWEKWNETYHTGAPTEFTDARRWGFLVSGTPIHLPVPAAELQILELPIYTFGAGEGGAAP